ncbi:MAG: Rid family detoxifying hydrolase [Salinirussus sp.]
MEEIRTADAPVYEYPFSQAIQHGDTIYLSGQVPVDPETMEIVDGGITEQTAQVMENAAAILEAADASLDDILKSEVYLTDIDDFDAFNRVYAEYVSDPKPARSAYEVSDLAIDVAVEIDFIAEA